MEKLQKQQVAAMPAFDAVELLEDPHLHDRKFFEVFEHPVVGSFYTPRPPWLLSETPSRITGHAPLLGEHNNYVFGELLGMSQQEIDDLTEQEILY